MKVIFSDFVKPESFSGTYEKICERLQNLQAVPMGGLLERIIRAEEEILVVEPEDRTNDDVKYLSLVKRDFTREMERVALLEKEIKKKEVTRNISVVELELMQAAYTDDDKEMIYALFEELKEGNPEQMDPSFLTSVKEVPIKYLTAYMKIIQAPLKGVRDVVDTEVCNDSFYERKIITEFPNMVNNLPEDYADDIVDVLLTCSENGRSGIGLYGLMKQIPKQLGLVDYDESSPKDPKKVPNGHRKEFLSQAKMIANLGNPIIHELLADYPLLIEKHGSGIAERIMYAAMRVDESDFPEHDNIAIMYVGLKTGQKFLGNNDYHQMIIDMVEHKYFHDLFDYSRI